MTDRERDSTATGQVYRQLSEALRHGAYGPGRRLPAERTLAVRYGVSRVTLRNALQRLAAEGLVESVVGSGWYVSPQVVGEPPSVLQTFSEMARARGLRPTARILAQRVRAATLGEADQLHTAPGASVLEIIRLRGMDDTPICVDSAVLPLPLAAELVTADLVDQSLYEQLQARCGVQIDRSSYAVQAELADATLAEQLGVDIGWPVLVGHELAWDEGGRPVLIGLARYRGDAYRFQADLFRPRGTPPISSRPS